VTVWLDPLLIFGLGLGVDGAAIATVVSRLVFLAVGLWGAVAVHRLIAGPRLDHAVQDLRPMAVIAVPAVLTNVATPVASAFLASVLARFGDAAIAANAIIDRIVPVAFGGLFALSGTIGPILGQNWGAGEFGRMRGALRDGAVFAALYVGTVWLVLILARGELAALFRMTGLAAELVGFFCIVSGPIWFFNGLLFVANASFNNLGFPMYSALFNWGRATLGTMPFAALGAEMAGAKGAIAGVGMGSLLFGVGALVVAFRTIHKLERRGLYRAA
jgi:Na+-driven multidrug efflux pump